MEQQTTMNQTRDLLLESILSGVNNGVFVEIGTYLGDFADRVLSISKTSRLYCVDPYTGYSDYSDTINNHIGDEIYNNTYNRLKSKYGDRVQFIRQFSVDAIGMIPNNIDLLHIDGNHSYKFVRRDLEMYFPKVRANGFILGSGAYDEDDTLRDANGNVFIQHSQNEYGEYGVIKAFGEFITENNLSGAGGNNRILMKKTAHPRSQITPKNDIVFVTLFKDIGRDKWLHYKREPSEYIECFMRLARSIPYKLVVYIEPQIRSLLANYTFGDNVIFINFDSVEHTFIKKYIGLEREIITSQDYQNRIPDFRKNQNPEHVYPEYTLINHSKINYLRDAKQNVLPNYMFYAWIDFGYAKNDAIQLPKAIDLDKLPTNKLTYHTLRDVPDEKIDPNYILGSDDLYLTGSSFIVPNSIVEAFEVLYEYKLIEWQTRWIADDDQSLVLQIYQDHPGLFNLIKYPAYMCIYNFI
jgi:hypothetical protein